MKNIKNVLILGFGISGQSAAKTLVDKNIKVYVYDDNIRDDQKYKSSGTEFLYSKSDIEDKDIDLVMKSPGIPLDNDIVRNLKKDLEVISDIELAYRLNPKKKIIAITGTNGKTTTAMVVNKILIDGGIKSELAGNIGRGAVEVVTKEDDTWVVLECSSFQLDDTKYFKPHIGLITNIETDHLEYHKTLASYENAKAKLVKNLDNTSYMILNKDDKTSMDKFTGGNYKKIYVSAKDQKDTNLYYNKTSIYNEDKEEILNLNNTRLIGLHNYYNIMQAAAVGLILGIDTNSIQKSIDQFDPVEHRIELVKEENHIQFYNDSKATNIGSTQRAIDSFESDIILIMGGYDKGEVFDEFIGANQNKLKHIVVFGSNGEKIIQSCKYNSYEDFTKATDLKDALKIARSLGEPGDTILFSPASSSYDMYDNFEQRGRHFKELVLEEE